MTDELKDAVERLTPLATAYWDSGCLVNSEHYPELVGDIRLVLDALREQAEEIERLKASCPEQPCPVCGNEVYGQGGYLQCECPAWRRKMSASEQARADAMADAETLRRLWAELAAQRERNTRQASIIEECESCTLRTLRQDEEWPLAKLRAELAAEREQFMLQQQTIGRVCAERDAERERSERLLDDLTHYARCGVHAPECRRCLAIWNGREALRPAAPVRKEV